MSLYLSHQDDKQQRQNEMINNECGGVYRHVVLLMLSVA